MRAALGLASLLVGCGRADRVVELQPPFRGVVIDDNAFMVTQKSLSIRLDEAASVSGRCVATDGDDVVRLTPTVRGRRHTVAVRGLLADTAYRCVLRAGGGRAELALTTDPLPGGMPTWHVDDVHPAGPDHLTLFNQWRTKGGTDNDHKLIIVDRAGRVRWYRLLDLPAQAGVEAAWHPDGILCAGGQGYPPTVFALSGEVVWRAPPATSGGSYHHDVVATGREVVALTNARARLGGRRWTGFRLEERSIDDDGLTWMWDSQEAVDAGLLLPPDDADDRDVYHANAVQPVDDRVGEGFLVSLAHLDQIIRVDRHTRAIVWVLGVGGTFDLVDARGRALPDSEWFFMPHDPELVEQADGTATLLVHDNGRGRPDGTRRSRAVRYRIDLDAQTLTPEWSFTEPGWYEELWGDADHLDGGNVLITSGHCDFCEDVLDPDRRSMLVEVDGTGQVVWRLTMGPERAGLYRAQRLPRDAID